jgi:hypothetical protein
VTIVNKAVGAWTLVHILTAAGAPAADWRQHGTWPRRDGQVTLWRDSMSEHRQLEVHYAGGGGIYAANLVEDSDTRKWLRDHDSCCHGNFANHLRFYGGHVDNSVRWQWVRAWLGLVNEPSWPEHFAPLPAFEVSRHRLELHGMHADVLPHLGVIMHERSGFYVAPSASYIEPMVNWVRTRGQPDNPWGHDSPAWIFGGEGMGCPEWETPSNGSVTASRGFRARCHPSSTDHPVEIRCSNARPTGSAPVGHPC